MPFMIPKGMLMLIAYVSQLCIAINIILVGGHYGLKRCVAQKCDVLEWVKSI